jgi:hypothetical protein
MLASSFWLLTSSFVFNNIPAFLANSFAFIDIPASFAGKKEFLRCLPA